MSHRAAGKPPQFNLIRLLQAVAEVAVAMAALHGYVAYVDRQDGFTLGQAWIAVFLTLLLLSIAALVVVVVPMLLVILTIRDRRRRYRE